MSEISLNKTTRDKISFLSYIVPAFAEAYKMPIPAAFKYLKKYGGWKFINENWWALHTDNDIWTIHEIYQVCLKNGGMK
jgi:hypothetical protein